MGKRTTKLCWARIQRRRCRRSSEGGKTHLIDQLGVTSRHDDQVAAYHDRVKRRHLTLKALTLITEAVAGRAEMKRYRADGRELCDKLDLSAARDMLARRYAAAFLEL